MAFPSVTYTFVNTQTSDGPQVSQNFTDLVNGMSDGTKDLNINALTAAGTATLNGDVVIGSAAADTITVNGTTTVTSAGDELLTVRTVGASNKSQVLIQVPAAGTGDAAIQWAIASGQTYTFGIDNSVSDRLVLSAGDTLGTTNILSFSSGRTIGIGGAPDSSYIVSLSGNPLTGPTQAGYYVNFTSTSDATDFLIGFHANTTTGASFTCGVRAAYFAGSPGKGSGSTITRDISYYAEPSTQGSTGNVSYCDNLTFSGSFAGHFTQANPWKLSKYLEISDVSEDPGAPTDGIRISAKASTDGTPAHTLSLRTEQAVETIGTFTGSHKLRVWINNVEYYIELDAV